MIDPRPEEFNQLANRIVTAAIVVLFGIVAGVMILLGIVTC